MKKKIEVIRVKDDFYNQTALVVHPGNNQIIVGSFLSPELRFLDRAQGMKKWYHTAHMLGVSEMILTPNGRYLITGGQAWYMEETYKKAPCIRIWETTTLKLIWELPGHVWTVSGLDISMDLRYLISVGSKFSARPKIWDLTTGTAENLVSPFPAYIGCAISPDGTYYAYNEGIFKRENKERIFEFKNCFLDFYQFSTNGDFLLCGANSGHGHGFYIVWFTLLEITMKRYCDSIGFGNSGLHKLIRISPNNRYIVYLAGGRDVFLVIVDVQTGEIVESYTTKDYPQFSLEPNTRQSCYQTLTVSQDGQIYFGYSDYVDIITPNIDLSCKSSERLTDPEIINPDRDHLIDIFGDLYDTRKYLQIYDNYDLPANELQGLLRIATSCSYGENILYDSDFIADKYAIIKKKHVVEFDFEAFENPVFPTPQEFPHLEIIRNYYGPIPEDIHLHKHLRVLGLMDTVYGDLHNTVLPVSLAQMPHLEYVGSYRGLPQECFPPEMRPRIYEGVIISPLEVIALRDWVRILHQQYIFPLRNPESLTEREIYQELSEETPSYFSSLEHHVNHLILRLDEDHYEDNEEVFLNFLDDTQFHPSLCNLKWVTKVEIPDIGLIQFPVGIQSWLQLEELSIYVHCLELPTWVTEIPTLQKLVVRGESIIEIPMQMPILSLESKIEWHLAYEKYYETMNLTEISESCNASQDNTKMVHPKGPISYGDLSTHFLDLRFGHLSSFESIHKEMTAKGVTHIYLRHNHFLDLETFPSMGENLVVLDLGCNNLQNLVGLPTLLPETCLLLVDGNPLRSLSGLPRQLYEHTLILNFWGKKKQQFPLHPRILSLLSQLLGDHLWYLGVSMKYIVSEFLRELRFDEGILEQIIQYYEKTPQMLVDIVSSKPSSIPEEVCERLIHEGGYKERQTLELHLPSNHPILVALDKRLQVETEKGYSIQL